MKDLEELLQNTLTDARYRIDPPTDLYGRVQARASKRHRAHLTVALAAAGVVAVAAASGVALDNRSHGDSPTTNSIRPVTTLPTPAAIRGSVGSPVYGADGVATDVVSIPTNTWAVFDAGYLERIQPTGGYDPRVALPPGGNYGAAADLFDEDVWVWGGTGITHVALYSGVTDQPISSATIPGHVFSAASVQGVLWLATSGGLWQVDGRSGDTSKVTSITGSVFGVAADETRSRVIVGVTTSDAAFEGAQIDAIDAETGAVTVGPTTAVSKESIAVVGDQIWVAGYANETATRIVHLDAATLRPVGSSPVDDQVGPGAQVWDGQNVVWVRNGGNEGLSCIDPVTGSVLETWADVQGPVTSFAGQAYAASDGNLEQLNLAGKCTG